jgi:type I thyroxine 5'-deiodinase
LREGVLFATPSSFEEREQAAGSCVRKLGIEFPALVDRYDDAVEREYTGWPDRLYVINAEGRLAYKSKPGPYGFRPAEMAAVLDRLTSAR